MSHNHSFQDQKDRLQIGIIGNIVLTIVELVAGILSNSTSVLSIAVHDFTDVVSTLVARWSVVHAEKPSDETMTFGYYRSMVFGALFNSLFLIGITIYIMYQGVLRLINPVHVDVTILAGVALFSMLVNGLLAYNFWKGGKDVNMQAVFWHMADDFIGGVAVLAVAVITVIFDWHYADGIATLLVGLIVLKGIWGVLMETYTILMEATPLHLSISAIQKTISGIKGVKGVHDLHVWTLGANMYCLSAHVQVKNQPIGELQPLSAKIKQLLQKKYSITHTTIEFDCDDCQITH